jgi:hypothetical protein
MKYIKRFFQFLKKGIMNATLRFPLTVASFVGVSILVCYMIWLSYPSPLLLDKLIFALLVSAILGMVAQFALERFERLSGYRWGIYGIAVLLAAGYFLLLLPAPEISAAVAIRTLVAVFAMICAVLWLPSEKNGADFNRVALVHFKAIFTSVLYAAVLSAGSAAIIVAVDILLFP